MTFIYLVVSTKVNMTKTISIGNIVYYFHNIHIVYTYKYLYTFYHDFDKNFFQFFMLKCYKSLL